MTAAERARQAAAIRATCEAPTIWGSEDPGTPDTPQAGAVTVRPPLAVTATTGKFAA